MGPMRGARARSFVRRGGVAALALAWLAALLAATTAPAAATVRGGCTAQGTSTSGGEIDLTSNAVWYVRSTDTIQLFGQAPTGQTAATVRATAFGFAIPIGSGTADPSTAAESDTFEIEALAILGRVFLISGASTGPAGGCDGEVLLIIEDVNPILTVLGGGGIILILVGLAGLGWAVRNPTPLIRRGIGVIGLVLTGVGISLVLQQSSTPPITLVGAAANGDPGQLLERSPFIDSVVAPSQLSLDPTFLLQSGILAALILILLPFPSQLFNSTLEQNWDEIRGWFRRVPLAGRLVRPTSEGLVPPAPRVWWRRFAVAAFVLAAGLLYGLLDPNFGPDARSFVTYIGIVLGLVVVTWAANLPSRSLHGRLASDRGRLWVVPTTLAVAAFCVLISRLVGFLPGYLYGLIFGYAFAAKIEPPQEGRAGALGAWWMLAVAAVAWLTLGAVRIPGVEDTVQGTIAEAVLAALVVAGIEGVVFALMPMRFLPGELVFRWHRLSWVLLYALGLLGFVWILLNPANGYLPSEGTVPFVIALALFVGFGVASILFWGYFRFRPKQRAA